MVHFLRNLFFIGSQNTEVIFTGYHPDNIVKCEKTVFPFGCSIKAHHEDRQSNIRDFKVSSSKLGYETMKIAIIGTGRVGSSIAYALVLKQSCDHW
jgi:hypothetical protein